MRSHKPDLDRISAQRLEKKACLVGFHLANITCDVSSTWQHRIQGEWSECGLATFNLPSRIVKRTDRREADEGCDSSGPQYGSLIRDIIMYYGALNVLVVACVKQLDSRCVSLVFKFMRTVK